MPEKCIGNFVHYDQAGPASHAPFPIRSSLESTSPYAGLLSRRTKRKKRRKKKEKRKTERRKEEEEYKKRKETEERGGE